LVLQKVLAQLLFFGIFSSLKSMFMKNNFLFVSSFLIILFSGACSKKANENLSTTIQILDKKKLLSPEFYSYTEKLTLSGQFLYAIRVVDTVDTKRIGVVADEFFETDTELHPQPEAFENKGVYLFVSQQPPLVQMRTGNEITLLARWSGITAGTEYLAIQEKARNGQIEEALKSFIQKAEKELPQVTNLSGIERFIMNDFTTFLSDETDALSKPSESFYGDFILKTAIKLRSKQLSAFGGLWLGYLLVFAVAFISIWLFNKLVFSFLLRNAAESVKSTGKALLEFLIGLFFAIPAVGSAVLLSGARLEDQVMLKEMGIEGLGSFGISPDLYNEPTAWYLALFVFIIFLAKALFAHPEWLVKFSYPPIKQREDYYTFRKNDPVAAIRQAIELDTGRTDDEANELALSPYTYLLKKHLFRSFYFAGVIALAAYFFIPKAFVLAAFYFWIIALTKNLFLFIKASKNDVSIEAINLDDIQSLTKKLETDPNNSEILSRRAEKYIETDQFELALKDYEQLLQTDPKNQHWYFQKASALDTLERYEEALEALKHAELYGAKKTSVSNNRALIFQKTGKLKEAISEYDQLITNDRKWWLPFYNRATCYHAQGEFRNAIDDYSEALKLKPDETDIYLHRAQALAKYGKTNEAIKDYSAVIKNDRTDAENLYQRAALYFELKKYSKAIGDYYTIEEIHAEVSPYQYIADVYRNRAEAEQLLHNFSAAIKDYTKLIELEPTI
jgi:tetratricopeptide (TPR) repeat protein